MTYFHRLPIKRFNQASTRSAAQGNNDICSQRVHEHTQSNSTRRVDLPQGWLATNVWRNLNDIWQSKTDWTWVNYKSKLQYKKYVTNLTTLVQDMGLLSTSTQRHATRLESDDHIMGKLEYLFITNKQTRQYKSPLILCCSEHQSKQCYGETAYNKFFFWIASSRKSYL